MSASIDKEDATDPAGGARSVLASWLDSHAAGECDRKAMETGFLDACRRNAEAPWDALALLDQYQRRGKLKAELARTLKSEIAQMVFGVPQESGKHTPRGPAAASADSGSRWQGLKAARPATLEQDDEDEVLDAPASSAPLPKAGSWPSHPPVRVSVRKEETARQSNVLRERYELLEVLGRGADGIVHRALDLNRQHLSEPLRYVAVKVLHRDQPLTPEALIEYQRRALLAQTLVHPHVARILDFDHDGDVHFLVMELLQGDLLDALMRAQESLGLVQERALKIVADVGAALAYLHEHGVVLGNLTPRKIFITPTAGAKLIDVGFDSIGGRVRGEDELLYLKRYASADRGSGVSFTASDDLYALACIAYELLTGRHPYGGHSGGFVRLQAAHPEPIAALPRPAWAAMERALRLTRAERDLSVAEFVTALTGQIQSKDRASAYTAILAPRRRAEPTHRSRPGVWLAAVAVIALSLVAAWWLLPMRERARLLDDVRVTVQNVFSGDADVSAAADPAAGMDSAEADVARTDSAAGSSAWDAITAVPADNAAAAQDDSQNDASPEPADKPTAASPSAEVPSQPATPAIRSRGFIGFSKDTYVVRESDVVARIPVTRSRGAQGEISFRWSIEGNSAIAGEDFAAIGPDMEFMTEGQRSMVLHIPLVSDSEREGTEMFLVHIDQIGRGARATELTRAAVIIVDDD